MVHKIANSGTCLSPWRCVICGHARVSNNVCHFKKGDTEPAPRSRDFIIRVSVHTSEKTRRNTLKRCAFAVMQILLVPSSRIRFGLSGTGAYYNRALWKLAFLFPHFAKLWRNDCLSFRCIYGLLLPTEGAIEVVGMLAVAHPVMRGILMEVLCWRQFIVPALRYGVGI